MLNFRSLQAQWLRRTALSNDPLTTQHDRNVHQHRHEGGCKGVKAEQRRATGNVLLGRSGTLVRTSVRTLYDTSRPPAG
jgi:hypothetical protein